MLELLEANWVIAAIVAVLALAALWLFFRKRAAKRRERHRAPDALDAGVPPAQRNRALIDAPSAATLARSQKNQTEKE